ncbi:MAG: hypothetical protein DI587_17225 [Variovorax paradoxus]|nr:MAG: hypothetical protein DI583_17225 [Variovorax paradoxus]PZQ08977.1 MAG: hypothetical protein DI587_17225 [Variovorax paradoxus]
MKLKRVDWSEPVEGDLKITDHSFIDGRPPGLEAQLVDDRCWTSPVSIIKPLFDPVLACTFKQGFLLRGYEIWTAPGAVDVREVRQIWYCVPTRKGPAASRQPGALSMTEGAELR